MSAAFLSVLKNCYQDAVSGRYSGRATETVCSLDAFIVSGVVSKSKVDQFILENYKMSISEMTKKYNQFHIPEKLESTFRGQYSLLGDYVSSVFRISSGELGGIFATDDEDGLRNIRQMIRAFEIGKLSPAERFPYLAGHFVMDVDAKKTYDLRECTNEIRFLKMVDIQNIMDVSGGIDYDKLSFVLKILGEPLVEDRYVDQMGCKKKVKRAFINHDKLELCSLFDEVMGVCFRQSDESGVSGDSQGVSFSLDLPHDYQKILFDRLERFDALPKDVKNQFQAKAEADEISYKQCRQFLGCYTSNGFTKMIKKINPYVLKEVLKEYQM